MEFQDHFRDLERIKRMINSNTKNIARNKGRGFKSNTNKMITREISPLVFGFIFSYSQFLRGYFSRSEGEASKKYN